jgi:hypothetical protein
MVAKYPKIKMLTLSQILEPTVSDPRMVFSLLQIKKLAFRTLIQGGTWRPALRL